MVVDRKLFGGVEAGGTKFVCAIGSGPDDLEEVVRFSTTTPEETLSKTVDYFGRWKNRIQAIGIGSFGPLNIDPHSPTYGCIEKTPKPGWSGTDIYSRIEQLGLPTAIYMDVGVSARGEHAWGAGQGLRNFLYITVGTGIGGTALIDGVPLSGLAAPEMGHLLVPVAEGDSFAGICPFHGRCLEGLASGPAIESLWGQPGSHLGKSHPAWDLEAEYLSSAVVNYILTLSPQRIIIGGGVAQQEQLFPLIRTKVQTKLSGYVDRSEVLSEIDNYIVPPELGNQSGILGCLVMASKLVELNEP